VINDRPDFWLIYLPDTERALLDVNMGFSDADRILVVEQKNILRNFQLKVEDCMKGLNKLLKNLLEIGTTAIDEAGIFKAYSISLVFLFCNIRTQTGYYKKGMRYLVANFLSCNVAKYY